MLILSTLQENKKGSLTVQHTIEKSKMRPGKLLLMLAVVILLLGGCTAPSATSVPVKTSSTITKSVTIETPATITTTVSTKSPTLKTTATSKTTTKTATTIKTTTPTALTPGLVIPITSACAITSPPPSMVGINTHTEVYGQDADPNMITLGPKLSFNPNNPGYATHHSMVWELKIHGTPVLAPIDMVLVGFQNSSAYRVTDGQNIIRMDNLDLWFESASPDWPGMIIYVYHLSGSPLLLGQNINPDCSACEEGQRKTFPAQGHIYMPYNDYIVTDAGNGGACEALLGYKVKRGELIGFAGTMPAGVGTHSFVDIGFKVSDTSENPLFGLNPKGLDPSFAQLGNRYLHWVQPSAFFYWKSYSPDADFPSGVLAYPFECDAYQLPAEQHNVNFKYTARK
jgi:hypothetical protein